MNNANLTRLVFEYNGAEDIRYGNNALHFVHYLKEIVFKGTQGCVWVSGSSMSEVGMSVTGHKLIVVPAGCLEKYQSLVDVDYEAKGEKHKELYTKLVDTFGYVMCEEGNVPEDPKPQISYSVDGSSWSDALPSSFATLHAKTRDDYAMTSGDLVVLKNAIAGQAAPVVLDLSEAVLETETFPATFMASVDEPNTSLKSVVFPSNVTAVESGAFKYCEALESMDLEGVTFIGSDAFRGTGLKKVDVPSSVLSVGDYSFSYLPAVEEIYYNSPFDKERHENNYMHAFCNRNNTDDWNSAAYPMVFTAGPEAKVLGRHFFDTNAKLVELIIEGDDVLFGQEWAIRAYNLKRIEFKVGVPSSSSLDAGADLAKHIGANQGRIVCPDGKYDEFAASPMISALVATGKFVLKEKSKEFEEEEVPPAAVQYSEDGIEWSNDIPSEFSSLHLKTNDEAVLTASVLTEVAGMIARQSSPVSLYLGDVAYESETFPAVFKAAEDSPNTSLKSIIFPSNITVIDDEAFFHCAALESVDLGNIVDIGDAAFRYSGLKSVRIDKQVTKMGRFSFGNCYNMTEAYFNVPVSNIPTSSSTANNWHVFGWETQGLEKTNDFTLTIGPDSTLPRYMCADNHNLVKLILEYDGTADREFCNNALNRTWYLATVVCHGKTGQMLQPQEPVVGEKVTGTKYLVVPDGCTDAYKNHTSEDSMYHKFCCEFTYKENNVEKTHNNGFRIIEQSAYDAL